MGKTLFMDFFGVFVDETVSAYYQYHHFSQEQKEEANAIFRQGDLGNILYPEVRTRVGAIDSTPFKTASDQLFAFSKPKKETIEISWKLKEEGFEIYLLSNASLGHLLPLLEKYHLDPLFDKRFISAQIHHAKPDMDFWLYVLNDLGKKGDDCIRIDDRKENIEGARSAHCLGIVFHDARQRYKEIHSDDYR